MEVIKKVVISENKTHYLEILNKKYGRSLKGIKIELKSLSSDQLKTCFAYISRFESLESLEITFCSNSTEEPIDKCLKLLANKCTKLRELRFKTYHSPIKLNRIFFSFSAFRLLERLIIDFGRTTDKLKASVGCLNNMTQLKHLSITYSQLTQVFFADIYKVFLKISCTLMRAVCGISIGHSQQQCVKHLTLKRVITKRYIFCSYLALLYTRIN